VTEALATVPPPLPSQILLIDGIDCLFKIPELNDFGQHLQVAAKTVNQTGKQRHLLKFFILMCQILFLIIGVLVALVLAIIWRYYHCKHIFEYLCKRDPSRIYCYSS